MGNCQSNDEIRKCGVYGHCKTVAQVVENSQGNVPLLDACLGVMVSNLNATLQSLVSFS